MISCENFIAWAESRLGEVRISGNEVKICSPFCEDYKFHLWCNCSGGKKGEERPYGVYRCWKTDQRGTLVSLVMKVDNCTFDEALETLGTVDVSFSEMERLVNEMFDKKATQDTAIEIKTNGLNLPDHTFAIDSLPEDDYYKNVAEYHLKDRKIPTKGLYVCTSGDYKNRIVIPYFNKNGFLFYYNCRDLSGKSDQKYLGPPKEIGIGKGDVVYFPDGEWPIKESIVYLCEGEFNALALKLSGLNSAAFGGKTLTEIQANMLIDYVPVVCIDNDEAGLKALPVMGEFLLSHGFNNVFYVRPPKGYKDWNNMYVDLGDKVVKLYVEKNKKKLDPWDAEGLQW